MINYFLIIIFIIQLLLGHCEGSPDNCKQSSQTVKRTCTDGNGKSIVCYPAELMKEEAPNHQACNCKASRRFELPATKPDTNCAAEVEARKYGEEFEEARNAFLEDEYHQMFFHLAAYVGLPECGRKVAATGTTKKSTIGPNGTKTTTTATVEPTKPATTSKKTPTTSMVPVPYEVEAEEVVKMPNSYRLTNALRDGCNITISGEIKGNETGQFAIHLVHNTPEPAPGIGESMFLIEVTGKMIYIKFRFNKTAAEFSRKDKLNGTELDMEIKVSEKVYTVLLDGKMVANVTNGDHPVWAIDYIHYTGDLEFTDTPDIFCSATMPIKEGSIDHSEKLDKMGPADLLLTNVEVKDQSKGAIFVYLLKECQRFDMRVCTHAMEYKLAFDEEERKSHLDVHVYSRQHGEDDPEKPMKRRIGGAMSNMSLHGDIIIGMDVGRGIDMRMSADNWQKAKLEGEEMEKWAIHLYNFADFMQIFTEDGVKVGEYKLKTASRVMALNGDKKFEANATSLPWIMEQKLTNWTNGDYVELRIKMPNEMNDNNIHLIFYRGRPELIVQPIDSRYRTGQKLLEIEINSADGNAIFVTEECNWITLRENECKVEGKAIAADKKPQFEKDKEYVIRVMAEKNNSKCGYKLDILDITNKTPLATYVLPEGPPHYIIEYLGVNDGGMGLVLMDKPKFCKEENDC